jgi:polyhydroxybutyrate depolymerase
MHDEEIRVDEKRREYQLYVPIAPRRPAPVVVALHRFTENGRLMAKLTGFNEVADREGFVVVYPNGSGRRFEAWESDSRDDVALVLAILEDVARRVSIDRNRVYVTGASNGGFLTHRLACLEPAVFAAAAPVMALMPKELSEIVPDGDPVPMLIVHGDKDWIVPAKGSNMYLRGKHSALSLEETVTYWVRRNGCEPNAVTTELPDRDPEDKTRVVLHRYPGPVETLHYEVVGGGHTWPGGTERAPAFIVGRTSRDVSASELIWEFFSRHRRP